MMEKGIDANIPLDYIEFQIFPSQNRYEACVCQGKTIETVTSALLEPLLLHSTIIKSLQSEGFDAKYKLMAPEDGKGVRWFKKATLIRFLEVIGASEVMNTTNAVQNEMSQLEEARKFHLSLYSKGPQDHLENGKAGNSYDNASTLKAGIGSASPDDSKNELLRAIDLRLTALRGELATALTQSASATCSKEVMVDLEKFSHHFGATDLRDSLRKLVDLNQEKNHADFPSDSQSPSKSDLERNRITKKQENNLNCHQPQSDTPVKYSASPAKAAQVERESSSENGESSCSSDEDEPSSERSRTLIRSASPRRSASPMRRVQIGRSGSRRSSALTIKSLNYFPRERSISQKDAATLISDEEAADEQASKTSESNVNRISVQDAISLFESKQKDQIMDIQKIRSSLNVKVGANKSVLRRWSAGAGENFSEDTQSTSSNSAVSLLPSSLGSGEITSELPKEKAEQELPSNDLVQPAEVGIKPDSTEQRLQTQACIQENIPCSQTAENSEKLMGSAEWSRLKEAELNQLLMKMMETKPVKYQTGAPDNKKSENLPSEKRGGLFDRCKENRNEKFQRETFQKRAEKEKQFRAMPRFLDERKAEMASANGSDSCRKHNVKLQKSQKTSSLLANPKKEISKSTVVKKASPKASPLPATRKSWPTTPSPRPLRNSPAKTPPGTSAVTIPTSKKLQPATSVPRLSPKVERTQLKPKSIKPSQNGTTKGVKDANEKQKLLKKSTKLMKPKLQSVDEDAALAKPSFYSKVTKKSSIVPVESKPFLRKGSGIGSGVNPASRIKVPPQPEETLIITGDTNQAEEKKMVSSHSDQAIQQQEVIIEAKKDFTDMALNIQVNQEKCEDMGTPVEVAFSEDDGFQNIADSALDNVAAEEADIPPTAWEEIEEHAVQPAPCSDSVCQNESPSNVASVEVPSSRVRHSLSQMLLEESSEPDVIDWGSAENPALLYQKDAPKGLKRLLNFARKSKADTTNPSVFSEGEDDADESKFVTKRSSDNLLKKAALHAKDSGHQKASPHDRNLDPHETFAQANTCKTIGHRLSEKLQEGQISAPVTSTKATRSFFSLSAFMGGKQSEMKFQ